MGLLTGGFSPLGWLLRAEAPPRPEAARLVPAAAPRGFASLSREERVRRAFAEIPLDPQERQALAALLETTDQGATATELSQRCGWMAGAWRTRMLLLCHRRRHFLWPDGLGSDITNGIILAALTDYDSKTLRFRARPGLCQILRDAVAAEG